MASDPSGDERITLTGLKSLALTGAAELEKASAEEIVGWAVENFGDTLAAACSMADSVIAHLVSRIKPGLDVLFLDTELHFDETLATRDTVAAAYDVNVITVTPALSLAEQATRYGPRLWERDPDLCCTIRKKVGLERALEPYRAWITGLRRDESPTRAGTKVVSWHAATGTIKICPIARWSQSDVDDYVVRHGIVLNPLLADGYPSIGCRPCTQRPLIGEDARAGRWIGFSKTECGIH